MRSKKKLWKELNLIMWNDDREMELSKVEGGVAAVLIE
jgi:hypothetical protein